MAREFACRRRGGHCYWRRVGGDWRVRIQPLPVREGGTIKMLSAGLTVYRIGSDGKLTFARKYDVDVGTRTQFWSGMVTLA